MQSLIVALLLAAPHGLSVESTVPVAAVRGHASLLASGIPEVPADLRHRVLQYLYARSASLLDVAADGSSVLIATRFGGTRQMHLVDHPRGDRYQLTFGEEPVASARFIPGDEHGVLFTQDAGGGEFFQIHRFDRSTGRSVLLSDGKTRHESVRLSRDGKRIAFGSSARNGKDTDVYVADLPDVKSARRLIEDGGTWHPLSFSPDGQSLLASRHRSVADSDLFVVDLATGKKRQITPQGPASVHLATFAADGKSVYLVTDRWSDFNELYRLDLNEAQAAPKALTRALRWNVEHVSVSRDGARVAIAINEDGYSKLFFLDPATDQLTPFALPQGVIGELHFPAQRSDLLFLEMHSPRSAADVWHVDLNKHELVRWTRSEVGGLDLESFAIPELVRYPSTGGVEVPALLYRPKLGAGARAPVVIFWHGGPEGQSRPAFAPFVQMLVAELGVAVLLPNVRGSDGYGKTYLSMDDGIKREDALQDIGATLDYIARQPDLDAARVGVYGGSYGGYMTLASVAFYPKRIRAGVDVVGISSLPTFLSTTQGYRRDLRRAEYGDERDPNVRAVQERISPLTKVEAIEAALFVQQGKNDPRVPQSEAEQLVRALRARGRDVWYLLALNEGHGFKKKANSDFAAVATVMFLRAKLLPAK